jgi:amphi-Trp domain-containing protein
VTEFEHTEDIPRHQAAERLADIAYALTAGGTLELRTADERVRVPVANDVCVERTTRSSGGRTEVRVVLTWIT